MSRSIASTMPQSLERNRRIVAVWLMATAIALLSCAANSARGQGKLKEEAYQKAWLTNKDFNARRVGIVKDSSPLQNPRVAAGMKAVYGNVFNAWTHAEQFANIPALREGIVKDLYNAGRSGNVVTAKFIRDIAFAKCQAIAGGNYHPAARVNAVLMLGELNDQEMNSLEKRLPKPMSTALPLLLQYVTAADSTDAMRVAALHGLQRHALFGGQSWPAATKDRIAGAMIQLAESKAPKGRDKRAHGWIQNMAIDTLIKVNSKNAETKLAELVYKAPIAEDASGLLIVHAAKISPDVKIPDQFAIDTDKVTKTWASHMANVIGREAQRIEDFEKPRPEPSAVAVAGNANPYSQGAAAEESGGAAEDTEGMYSQMGAMGYGEGMGTAAIGNQTPEIKLSRRMINYVFESFHRGLSGTRVSEEGKEPAKGLVTYGDEDAKQMASELLQKLDESFEVVNDKTLTENKDYAEKLRDLENTFLAFVDPSLAKGGDEEVPTIDAGNIFGGADFGAPEAPAPAQPAPGLDESAAAPSPF